MAEVAELMRSEWQDLLAREGIPAEPAGPAGENGEPGCPACGAVAPLVNGACADCGLQLG